VRPGLGQGGVAGGGYLAARGSDYPTVAEVEAGELADNGALQCVPGRKLTVRRNFNMAIRGYDNRASRREVNIDARNVPGLKMAHIEVSRVRDYLRSEG
jgi:hypothetical protein